VPLFLCRLNAPRPTFPQDITDEERALMDAHAAYWQDYLETRELVVFGPVADPAGTWGVAVLEVADEARAQALTAADPVASAGRGFSYDVLPMPAGSTR
jgi:uncharacterized protein YciI